MWFLKIFVRLRRGKKKVLVLKGVSAKHLERFVLATLGRGAGLCGIRVPQPLLGLPQTPVIT